MKIQEGATSQGLQQPLEAMKGKEMNCPLQLPEAKQAYQHLDFSPMKLISDF